MPRPSSRRKEILKRTMVYSAMSLSVAALVTVLVLITLGYQLNRNDGKIEQGGLIQFVSHPSNATVSIDGANLGSNTPSKTTLTAGEHYITMQRNGYKQWQKSVNVLPGTVLWLNYTRLIPNDLTPTSVTHFSTVSSTIASVDRKQLAVWQSVTSPVVRLIDLAQDTAKVADFTLPVGSYTHASDTKTERFDLEKWDDGSRYMLVKHTYDGKREWLLVDSRDVTNTKNISKLFDVDILKLVFNKGDSNIVYAQIGTDIRRIDINGGTLSRPLVTNVVDFSLYDRSTITYATALDGTTRSRSIGYYEDGAAKPYTIRSYRDDGQIPLRLALGKYYGDMYEVISYGDVVEILQGQLPTDTKPVALRSIAKMNIAGGAMYLSVITDGRFVVAQNGATFVVYDLEIKKTFSTTLKGTTPFTSELGWLDEYMLWSDRDGMVRLYEFDGANQHDVMPVVPGFSITLSPNDKYLYGINKSSDGMYYLERVVMIP